MKNLLVLLITTSLFVLASCSNSNNAAQTLLRPSEFSSKLENTEGAILVDVRTPGEYEGGHIANSSNIDWNGSDFENAISKVDKNKPVFVYCLSGGRSGSAASFMRKNGFKEVYELDGGMLAWRNQKLPETKETNIVGAEMTTADFEKLIASEQYILVDFYAEWCGPCKKLKPILDEIGEENKDKVTIIGIDIDKNPTIAQQLGVTSIPALKLYKNRSLVWENLGLVEKEVITRELK